MSEHFIKDIEIKNYKLFKDFKSSGFGRVNLIGGKNNVGKTAFMEACYLSQSESVEELFAKLLEVKTHRNIINSLLSKNNRDEDLRELIKSNADVEIKIPTKEVKEVTAWIGTSDNKNFQEYCKWIRGLVKIKIDKQLSINLKYKCYKYKLNENTKLDDAFIPLDNKEQQWEHCDGLEFNEINSLINRLNFFIDNTKIRFSISYISIFSNSNKELENLIGELKLNKKYSQLNKYLKEIFTIDSIDIIKDKPMIEVKDNYLELSEFGQGIKSFINIIASLLMLKDNYLFIDELENGIHYSQYDKLWKIILTISKEQNVQVFATTHSKELIESYSRIAKKLEEDDIAFMSMYREDENIKNIVLDNKSFLQRVELGLENR